MELNYNIESFSDKQLKERIRFLSDKLEKIFNILKPQLDEFDLIKEELDILLEYADAKEEK